MKVILFKDPPTDPTILDPYSHCITERLGLDVQYIPVLNTIPDPNPLLDVARANPNGPKIIVVTSARSSVILAENWPFKNTSNQSVQVWVVGKATATPLRFLEQSGAVQIMGELTGNAACLADSLIMSIKKSHNHPIEPVIILKGDKSLCIIPNQLLKAKISFIEIQVYSTSYILDASTLSAVVADTSVKWWVFFSPSGVDAVLQFRNPPSEIKIAVIGVTTAEYLNSVRWTVHAVATMPNAEGLVEAMLLIH